MANRKQKDYKVTVRYVKCKSKEEEKERIDKIVSLIVKACRKRFQRIKAISPTNS